tara:strand:+ start:25 stop:462 length:438 start_codon:yes stop_codon:yes gene_type:complete
MAVIGGSGRKIPTALLPGRQCLNYGYYIYNSTSSIFTGIAANTPTNVIDITSGSGVLQFFGYTAAASVTGGEHTCVVTIDGNVVFNETVTGSVSTYGRMVVGSLLINNSADYANMATDEVFFNESLRITLTSTVALNSGHQYYLT